MTLNWRSYISETSELSEFVSQQIQVLSFIDDQILSY